MQKRFPVLVLAGALTCALTLPAMAADTSAVPISAPISAEDTLSLPDSVLYYGTVKEIVKGEDGSIVRLRMDSERYGEYVMNISAETVWIDSGAQTASDPASLREGEGIYVFHSAAATLSLPPQSAALAVARNIPMDAGCAQYHEVEEVSLADGQLKIVTDNGALHILADEDTGLSRYGSDEALSLADIQAGDQVMAWYQAVAESYPGQTHADHLMLLPRETPDTGYTQSQDLTRGELVSMLYERAGEPSVESDIVFSDVEAGSEHAEAIRWAAAEGLIDGYPDGTFGAEDSLTREQLAVILWRYAGSPMLMDYTALTQYSNADQISRFAQPAMAWAHQKGLISGGEDGTLAPQAAATVELAQSMLDTVAAQA